MEDPIRIDIWGEIAKGSNQKAVEFIRSYRPDLSELEIRKQVNYATTQREKILIIKSELWELAQKLKQNPPPWLCNIMLLEDDCFPSDFERPSRFKTYCAIHDFYFGGCRGCHICSGFFAR